MSEHTLNIAHKGRDLEIVYDFEGSYGGVQDGDFDLCVEAVHYDVDMTSKQGPNIIEAYDEDELAQLVCDNVDLSAIAYEAACDRADWLRDQRKDEGL